MLELLQGKKSVGQLAKSPDVHFNPILTWEKELLENGPQLFARDDSAAEYEERIAQLQQLLGKKRLRVEAWWKVGTERDLPSSVVTLPLTNPTFLWWKWLGRLSELGTSEGLRLNSNSPLQ